jgi:hypothetical protein
MKTLNWTKPLCVNATPGSNYLGIDTKVAPPRYLGSFVNALQETRHVVIVTLTDGTERCYYAADDGTTMVNFTFENVVEDAHGFVVWYRTLDGEVRPYSAYKSREQAEAAVDTIRNAKMHPVGITEVTLPSEVIKAVA